MLYCSGARVQKTDPQEVAKSFLQKRFRVSLDLALKYVVKHSDSVVQMRSSLEGEASIPEMQLTVVDGDSSNPPISPTAKTPKSARRLGFFLRAHPSENQDFLTPTPRVDAANSKRPSKLALTSCIADVIRGESKGGEAQMKSRQLLDACIRKSGISPVRAAYLTTNLKDLDDSEKLELLSLRIRELNEEKFRRAGSNGDDSKRSYTQLASRTQARLSGSSIKPRELNGHKEIFADDEILPEITQSRLSEIVYGARVHLVDLGPRDAAGTVYEVLLDPESNACDEPLIKYLVALLGKRSHLPTGAVNIKEIALDFELTDVPNTLAKRWVIPSQRRALQKVQHLIYSAVGEGVFGSGLPRQANNRTCSDREESSSSAEQSDANEHQLSPRSLTSGPSTPVLSFTRGKNCLRGADDESAVRLVFAIPPVDS
jgi:hypothetical protein